MCCLGEEAPWDAEAQQTESERVPTNRVQSCQTRVCRETQQSTVHSEHSERFQHCRIRLTF